MMDFKMVIGDPETGKSYQREIKEEKSKRLLNLGIGDEFEGEIAGLAGYKLSITGGSNKTGTPMRKGVHGSGKRYILTGEGVGHKPKQEGMRKRKLIAGEQIGETTIQVNVKITKKGKKKIEDLFGIEEKGNSAAEEKQADAPTEEEK